MITTVDSGLVTRTTTVADLGQLRQLELDGFEPAEQWSEDSWRAELAGLDRIVLVATIADEVVGAATWQTVGETADLHRIVVSVGHRRMGIASSLLAAGLSAVHAAGARVVLLEVAAENWGAHALYRNFGFTELATRANYYGIGRDARVLRLDLVGSFKKRPECGAQSQNGGNFDPKSPLSPTFGSEFGANKSSTEGREA